MMKKYFITILVSIFLMGLLSSCKSTRTFNFSWSQTGGSLIVVDIVAAHKLDGNPTGTYNIDKYFNSNLVPGKDFVRYKLSGSGKNAAINIRKTDPAWEKQWKEAEALYVFANLPNAVGDKRNAACQQRIPLDKDLWDKKLETITIKVSSSSITISPTPGRKEK